MQVQDIYFLFDASAECTPAWCTLDDLQDWYPDSVKYMLHTWELNNAAQVCLRVCLRILLCLSAFTSVCFNS